MWNTLWKNVWKPPYFHTLFTCFSRVFHMHFSHVCEILHSEMYVKTVWNDVNPFTHIFTCSFTREFYVNLDSISHEFSPSISHAFSLANWMWSRQVHMLFHTYFKPGYTVKLYIFTLLSSPLCDQHFTRGFTFFNQIMAI